MNNLNLFLLLYWCIISFLQFTIESMAAFHLECQKSMKLNVQIELLTEKRTKINKIIYPGHYGNK